MPAPTTTASKLQLIVHTVVYAAGLAQLKIKVIDSHTGGEPTRVVIAGGPELGDGPLTDRLALFREQHDHFRSAVINEPRGSDAMVGALLCKPQDPTCVAGVVFFNNVGYLGMCGHGTIGLAVTLHHLGLIEPGRFRLETPVGIVQFQLHDAHSVTVENVPSYRTLAKVALETKDYGVVRGDVAWGGNWFFLTATSPVELEKDNLDVLTGYCWQIRQALKDAGISGDNGAVIDHVEVYGPPASSQADSRNFVLCPGKSYDRSPCGTGTSAKLACLHADGLLPEQAIWRQQSITGSIFEATYRFRDGQLLPEIRGSAFITAESVLVLDDDDPFRAGIP